MYFAKVTKPARNTYESLSPLTWLLKIFAINSNVENESYSHALYLTKTLLTMTGIGCLNIYCLYYKITYVYETIAPSIKITDSVQMCYDHFQFIVDLWFIYKYGRHISIEYFKQYESIDTFLGLDTKDFTTIKWKLTRLLLFFIFIWLTSSAFDLAAWSQGYVWSTPMIYSIAYFYMLIKIMTTLDLTSHIMHIEVRLTIMADLVQKYYVASENLPGSICDSICKKNWLYKDSHPETQISKHRINTMEILVDDDWDEMQWMAKCYLLLTEQVEFINCMFGFRILINSLSLLIDIVRFTNMAVKLFIGTQVTYSAVYFPAVSSLLRMMSCVTILISLVRHCEKTYAQKDRIVTTVDHLLVNKNPNDKQRRTMVDIRALVLARPINFTLAKFFSLNYSFLVSIASVTVTYTIILLQSMN